MRQALPSAPGLLLALLVLTSVGTAQIQPGDLVLGDHGSLDGLFYFTPALSRCGTVAVSTLCGKLTPTGDVQWVENGLDNRSVLALWNDRSDLLLECRNGAYKTLCVLPVTNSPSGIAVDQDGTVLITDFGSTNNVLIRYDPATRLCTTVKTLPFSLGLINNVTVDDDNGDYILGMFGVAAPGDVLRINRRTLACTTLCAGLNKIFAIDHDQQSGNFYIAKARPGLVVCDRSGAVVASTNSAAAAACRVVDYEDKVYCVSGLQVILYDKALNAVCTWTLPPGLTPTSLDVYGDRKLIGRFDAQNPGRYRVTGAFTGPGSQGRAYCAAVSLGLRPGLGVGACAKVVNLDVSSPVFFLTACKDLPGLTRGFVGTTGTAGDFSASFTLPRGLPSGLTVHFAAVVLNPGQCGGVDCASSLSITVP